MTLAYGGMENCVKYWDMTLYSSALAVQLSPSLKHIFEGIQKEETLF